MFTVPAIAATPPALNLPPSVLSAVAAVNAVSTRQTPVAASAPPSDEGTGQYAQNNGAQNGRGAVQNEASAQFIAQAISQEDDDSTVALATTFERVAPAPEYNVFVSYSFIKYKPSDAGIPQLSLPLPAEPQENAPAPPAASEYQAYSNTQARNQSNLFPGATQLLVS